MKFTKREFKFFILGLVTAFLIAIIFEWGDELNDFKHGFMDGLTGQPYSADH
jgi:hypothetical protein